MGKIRVGMGFALTSLKEQGPAEGLSSGQAETDQGTTVARPFGKPREGRSGNRGSGIPMPTLTLPTQDPEEPEIILG